MPFIITTCLLFYSILFFSFYLSFLYLYIPIFLYSYIPISLYPYIPIFLYFFISLFLYFCLSIFLTFTRSHYLTFLSSPLTNRISRLFAFSVRLWVVCMYFQNVKIINNISLVILYTKIVTTCSEDTYILLDLIQA